MEVDECRRLRLHGRRSGDRSALSSKTGLENAEREVRLCNGLSLLSRVKPAPAPVEKDVLSSLQRHRTNSLSDKDLRSPMWVQSVQQKSCHDRLTTDSREWLGLGHGGHSLPEEPGWKMAEIPVSWKEMKSKRTPIKRLVMDICEQGPALIRILVRSRRMKSNPFPSHVRTI